MKENNGESGRARDVGDGSEHTFHKADCGKQPEQENRADWEPWPEAG